MVTMVCVCIESVSSVEGGPKGIRRRRLRRSRQRSTTPTNIQTGNVTAGNFPFLGLRDISLGRSVLENSIVVRSICLLVDRTRLYTRKHSELIYTFV